jgi:hypothetical protein
VNVLEEKVGLITYSFHQTENFRHFWTLASRKVKAINRRYRTKLDALVLHAISDVRAAAKSWLFLVLRC